MRVELPGNDSLLIAVLDSKTDSLAPNYANALKRSNNLVHCVLEGNFEQGIEEALQHYQQEKFSLLYTGSNPASLIQYAHKHESKIRGIILMAPDITNSMELMLSLPTLIFHADPLNKETTKKFAAASNICLVKTQDRTQHTVSFLQAIREQYHIKGSAARAILFNTIAIASGFAKIVILTPIINSTTSENISVPAKIILSGSGIILCSPLNLPFGRQVDLNGGATFAKILSAMGTAGAFATLFLTMTFDPARIKSFDSAYWLYFLASAFSGSSSALFQMMNNAVYWKNDPMVPGVTTCISGAAVYLTQLFLEFTRDTLDLPSALAILASLSLLETILSAIFLEAPPYFQLLKNFPPEIARYVALQHGQTKFPTAIESFYTEVKKTFFDRRTLAQFFNVTETHGVSLAAGISFFVVAQGFGASVRESVVVTSIGGILTALTRLTTTFLIRKFGSHNGGNHFFTGATVSTAAAALLLTAVRPPPSLAYLYTLKLFLDVCFGVGGAANISMLIHWSQPKDPALEPHSRATMSGILATTGIVPNSRATMSGILATTGIVPIGPTTTNPAKKSILDSYNIGTMLGIVGSFGGLAPFMLNLLLSGLTALRDEEGYLDNYAFMVALSVAAMITTEIAHRAVHNQSWVEFFKQCWSSETPAFDLCELDVDMEAQDAGVEIRELRTEENAEIEIKEEAANGFSLKR